jgi:hypothetical protein
MAAVSVLGEKGRTGRRGVVAALVGLWVLGLAGPAEALADVPGYRIEEVRRLAPGVEYRRLLRADGPVVAHVVAVRKDSGLTLRAVLSNERVAGTPAQERTSAMCQRVRCVAAVNADFASPSGEPIGAVVAGGQMLRSPVPSHHQLSVTPGGDLVSGTLGWSAQLVPSDLRPLAVQGLNVARPAEALVLYTPAYGPSTATNDFGAELVLRVVEPATSARLGQTALVELLGFVSGRGNSLIPSDGMVLSGHGPAAAALGSLWARIESGAASRRGLLRLETSTPVAESVGGTPVLVHEGKRWVADDGSNFVAGRHPRTIVGWNATETLLVTVDGRQPGYSLGLSLLDAADFLRALGATEAVNLDGGGSTTLAAGATVLNRPSDRMVKRGGKQQIVHEPRPGDVVVGPVERPVASGLAIVPVGAPPLAPFDPLAGGVPFVLGDNLAAAPADADPASIPGAGNFALLDLGTPPSPSPGLIAVAAGMEVAMAQWLLIVVARRRRRAIGQSGVV